MSASIALNPGDVLFCQSFDVILDDNFLEEPETFTLSVFQIGVQPKANFTQSHSKITIVDDESKICVLLACIHSLCAF